MVRRTGSADLPLHGGRVPAWLANRMSALGAVICEAVVHHYGRDEFLSRLAHPFWFQSFGAVMGMDWHSSGITTSVIGALKRGLQSRGDELGIYVCGGRGRHSRRTPEELDTLGMRIGFDSNKLTRASRLVAKVDSAAVHDAGFLLVRNGEKHKTAFSAPTAYLQRAERGLAAGTTWPCDLGPDLSRGFRALKTWMTIETLGAAKIGDAIWNNCELARYLASKIERSPHFALKAPVSLSIVCFGMRGVEDSGINRELVLDLHESGIAAPSWTMINGETVIRCAIINHRTTREDIDIVFDAMSDLAAKHRLATD